MVASAEARERCEQVCFNQVSPGASQALPFGVFAADQVSGEQADAQRDSDRLVRMVANHLNTLPSAVDSRHSRPILDRVQALASFPSVRAWIGLCGVRKGVSSIEKLPGGGSTTLNFQFALGMDNLYYPVDVASNPV